MVAKLQCEICGGKLIGKPGGIFECDSCGMEYDTAWAKAKIQEITGTVKVEGTVEVKGTVQVEGAASVYSLIKRGNLALEDAKWEDAKQCFNDVLNADPENAEAYFGLAMVESKSRSRDGFRHGYMYGNRMDYLCRKDLARAKQFGDEELKKWITELEEEKDKYLREEREKKEQLQKEQEEERRRQEEERRQREVKERLYMLEHLPDVRRHIAPAQGLISAGDRHTVGVKEDGTVIATVFTGSKENDHGRCDVAGWRNVLAVSTFGGTTSP